MAEIFRQKNVVKLPERNKESKHDQYGKAQKGIVKCPYCGNVNFEKEWHGSIAELRKKKKDKKLKPSSEDICPACKMIRNGLFEGELFVESIPKKYRKELLRLIKNYGKRDSEMDPQNRIIAIEEMDGEIRITTTENQLANRLAKKIKGAFNKVKVDISFSEDPYEVNRVHAIFVE
ncbi:MAG: hypothetical protein Q8Q32_01100 [bacterium]|nr:hypothetical protein [bacterium]